MSKCKGQLISKCLFGVIKFFQTMNENKWTWGVIVVKLNFFIHFLEELRIAKSPFEINWPLVVLGLGHWGNENRYKISAHKRSVNFKRTFCYPQFFQKTNAKIQLYYCDTSGRIVYIHFLEELKTPKRHFKIDWPFSA